MNDSNKKSEILSFTSTIVSSYVSNNTMQPSQVTDLIERVYTTLSNVGEERSLTADRPKPAVPIKKSITPDYLICLEDGKQLKMLKRHLKTAYGMSPEQYRERWGLSPDYPMVAPNYAKRRSALAKDIGLGRK